MKTERKNDQQQIRVRWASESINEPAVELLVPFNRDNQL
jgi:hypothetical protein